MTAVHICDTVAHIPTRLSSSAIIARPELRFSTYNIRSESGNQGGVDFLNPYRVGIPGKITFAGSENIFWEFFHVFSPARQGYSVCVCLELHVLMALEGLVEL